MGLSLGSISHGLEHLVGGAGHIIPKPLRPLLPIAGGIAGGYFGGPWGAAAGASLGGLASGKDVNHSLLYGALAGGGSYALQALNGASAFEPTAGGAEAWTSPFGGYEGGVGESTGVSVGGGEGAIPDWNAEFTQGFNPSGTTASGIPIEGGGGYDAVTSAGGEGVPLSDAGTKPGWMTPATGAALEPQVGARTMMQYPGFENYPGLGNPGWATTALGLLSAGYNFYEGSQYADAAKQASENMDPFRGYRRYYGKQLGELMQHPESIQNDPNYKLGLTATERSLAARGYRMSGNERNALADYTTHFAQDKENQLYQYAGGGATPGAGGALMLAGQQGQINTTNNALANLGWLSYRYGY